MIPLSEIRLKYAVPMFFMAVLTSPQTQKPYPTRLPGRLKILEPIS
jgi:hypothetical protein